jgi:hypothetical protein
MSSFPAHLQLDIVCHKCVGLTQPPVQHQHGTWNNSSHTENNEAKLTKPLPACQCLKAHSIAPMHGCSKGRMLMRAYSALLL